MGCGANQIVNEPIPSIVYQEPIEKRNQLFHNQNESSELSDGEKDGQQQIVKFDQIYPKIKGLQKQEGLGIQSQMQESRSLKQIKSQKQSPKPTKQTQSQSTIQNPKIIKTVQDLTAAIRSQIESNTDYDNLLSCNLIVDILDKCDRVFVDARLKQQMLDLVLDYMQMAKNEGSLCGNNFVRQIGARWVRINETIQYRNRRVTQMNHLLCRQYQNQTKCKFQSYRFNLGQNEVKQIARTVKQLTKHNQLYFSYFALYLYLSCLNLQTSKTSLRQIQQKLIIALQHTFQDIQSLPVAVGDEALYEQHQDDQNYSVSISTITIDFSEIQKHMIREYIDEVVQKLIERRQSCLGILEQLIDQDQLRDIQVQLISKQTMMDRLHKVIIQGKGFSRYSLEMHLSEHPQATIQSFTKAQFEYLPTQLQKVYEHIDEIIDFNPNQSIRAICILPNINLVNNCCKHLKQKIHKSQGIQLRQIRNQLRGDAGVCNITMMIVIKEVLIQLQLGLQMVKDEYSFDVLIGDMIQSNMLSPLGKIIKMYDQMVRPFFGELRKVIQGNGRSINKLKSSKCSYQGMGLCLQQIMGKVQCNSYKSQQRQKKLDAKKQRFRQLCSKKSKDQVDPITSQKAKNNGQFKYILKKYDAAAKQLQLYCTQLKTNSNLFTKIYTNANHFNQSQTIILRKYADASLILSNCYYRRNKHDKALLQLNLFRSIIRKAFSDDSQQMLWANKQKAELQFKRGNFNKAIQAYNQCLNNQQRIKGTQHIDLTDIFGKIANIFREQHNYKQALRQYQKSVSIIIKKKGELHVDCINIYHSIANIHLLMQNYQDVIIYLQKCYDAQTLITGKYSIQGNCYLQEMAQAKLKQHQFDEVYSLLRICLDVTERIKGIQSMEYADILNQLGQAYTQDKNIKQAQALLLRCLSIRQAQINGSLGHAETLANIGNVHSINGELQKALQYYLQSLAIQQKRRGKQSKLNLDTLNKIVLTYFKMSNPIFSQRYFQKCLSIESQMKESYATNYIPTLSQIANGFINRGNYPSAINYLLKILQMQQTIFGTNSKQSGETLNSLAEVYKLQGNYVEAGRQYQLCLSIREKDKQPSSVEHIQILTNIGFINENQQKYQQAIIKYQTVINLCERFNVKYLSYANACLGMGNCLIIDLLYETAKEYYQKALPIYMIAKHPNYNITVGRIYECYQQLNKIEESQQFKIKHSYI